MTVITNNGFKEHIGMGSPNRHMFVITDRFRDHSNNAWHSLDRGYGIVSSNITSEMEGAGKIIK